MRRWSPGDPIAALREVLARGGVLALPTESSYGLGVDPRSQAGVEAIFRLKERDRDKPLPVVAADESQIHHLGVDPEDPGLVAVRERWPAALTVLVRPRRRLPAMAGSELLGVRVPAHRELRRLLRGLGHALTATSANRSGEPPITTVEGLAPLLGDCDALVVDGGELAGGKPSTVVSWDRSRKRLSVVRPGRFELAGQQPFIRSGCGNHCG